MHTRRFIAIFLALLLSSSMLFSCASDTADETTAGDAAKTAADTIPEETEPPLPTDDLAPADFAGASYIIGGVESRTTTAVTSDELTGEIINDAQYNSARTVEARFNVVISYENLGANDDAAGAAVQSIVAGGEDTYSVVFNADYVMMPLSFSGHFLNIKDVEQFNFDKPWWTNSTDAIGVGDKAYVASSYLSYYSLFYMRILVINKDMADDLGIAVPYEQVFKGKWYMDDLVELAEIATIDLNGDGQMTDADQYGLAYQELYTLQSNMGIKVIDKDNNNIPFLAFDVDRAGKYLTKAETLFDNFSFGDGANMFANGKSLFCYCLLREVCNIIRDTDIHYGYLLCPKLDEAQEDYMAYATDLYWSIPTSSAAKKDMIGTITEALNCQHYNNVRPAFFETTMKTKLSDNENDMKVLDMAAERLCIDFTYAHQINLSNVSPLCKLYDDTSINSGNLASSYESVKSSIEESLERLVKTFNELP